MRQVSRKERRVNARSTKPLWVDIDRIPYLAENWSLSGIFIRDQLVDAVPGHRVLLRVTLDPFTGSPFADVFARIVRSDANGTALALCELPPRVFDLLSEAMFRRPTSTRPR